LDAASTFGSRLAVADVVAVAEADVVLFLTDGCEPLPLPRTPTEDKTTARRPRRALLCCVSHARSSRPLWSTISRIGGDSVKVERDRPTDGVG
jgi:hypothetical protein